MDYFAGFGYHPKPFQNPAEFILEVVGAGIPQAQPAAPETIEGEEEDRGKARPTEEEEELVPSQARDEFFFVEAYKQSRFYNETVGQLERGLYKPGEWIEEEREGAATRSKLHRAWEKIKKRLKDRYASTFWVQLTVLLERQFLGYWRVPENFLQKLLIPVIMGVIIGTLFLQFDDNQTGARQRAGLLFFVLLWFPLLALRKPSPLNAMISKHEGKKSN